MAVLAAFLPAFLLAVGLASPNIVQGCSLDMTETQASPYVAAYYEKTYSVALGCSSSSTLISRKEVHVINLWSAQRFAGTSTMSRVDLYITPPENGLNLVRDETVPMVIVLNSIAHEQPIASSIAWHVTWRGERKPTKHLFHLPSTDTLDVSDNMKYKVAKTGRFLSEQSQKTLEWVKNRYQNVTSFTEFRQANIIYLDVGTDITSDPSGCHLTNNFISPHCVSAYVERRPMTPTCSEPSNSGLYEREIHVISLVPAPQESQQVIEDYGSEVMVNIEASPRHSFSELVLVLRAQMIVKWILNVTHTSSLFTVVKDDTALVDTQLVKSPLLQLKTKRGLPSDPFRLVNAVRDKYGHLTSFSQVTSANRFYVRLGFEASAPVTALLSQVGVPGGHPKWSGGASLEQVSSSSESQEVDPLLVSMLDDTLNAHLIITCHNNVLRVAMPRAPLAPYVVSAQQVSLQSDPLCVAVSNGTHFILAAAHEVCKTKIELDNEEFFLTNYLYIDRIEVPSSKENASKERGVSGSGQLDDNDDGHTPIGMMYKVKCKINSLRAPEPSIAAPVTLAEAVAKDEPRFSPEDVVYQLKLYDSLFLRPIEESTYPKRLKVGEILHASIEVSEARPELRVVAKRCWVSTEEHQDNGKQKTLFANGCLFDPFVHILEQSDGFGFNRQHFSFAVEKYDPDASLFYLHCLIKLCSLTGKYTSNLLPKCSQKSDCSDSEEGSSSSNFHKTVHKYLGPLQVLQSDAGGPDSDDGTVTESGGVAPGVEGQDPERPPGNNQPSPVQKVIGIDMNLVVGISFASFIVGALLVVILWSIYACTKRRQHQRTPLSSENRTPLSQNGNFQARRTLNGKPWPVSL